MKGDKGEMVEPYKPLYTAKQAAQILLVNVGTVYDLMNTGQLPYGEKYVTILVHWNKSPRDTEKAATALFQRLRTARDEKVNNEKMKFFQPLYDIQDVGTDEAGVYEMVIEGVVIFEKEGKTV